MSLTLNYIISGYSVWYGEEDIATVKNEAGIWNDDYEVANMFDSDDNTLWHSAGSFEFGPKTMGVEFKEPINFVDITILKRQDCRDYCRGRYNNVCLILDDDIGQGSSGSNPLLESGLTMNLPSDYSRV